MIKQNTKLKLISSENEVISFSGTISYNESRRAWSLIQLKREVLQEFPQLKRRRGKFGYSMNIHRNFKNLKKNIKSFEKKGIIPILLAFGKIEG